MEGQLEFFEQNFDIMNPTTTRLCLGGDLYISITHYRENYNIHIRKFSSVQDAYNPERTLMFPSKTGVMISTHQLKALLTSIPSILSVVDSLEPVNIDADAADAAVNINADAADAAANGDVADAAVNTTTTTAAATHDGGAFAGTTKPIPLPPTSPIVLAAPVAGSSHYDGPSGSQDVINVSNITEEDYSQDLFSNGSSNMFGLHSVLKNENPFFNSLRELRSGQPNFDVPALLSAASAPVSMDQGLNTPLASTPATAAVTPKRCQPAPITVSEAPKKDTKRKVKLLTLNKSMKKDSDKKGRFE